MLKRSNIKGMISALLLGSALSFSFAASVQARPDFGEGLARFERGDYQGALKSWAPLALKGDADSLFNLGQMYRFGYGVDKDKLRAKIFYNEAAERGHPAAERILAADLFYADPAERDLDRAVQLFWSSALKGDAPSQYMLATLYYSGEAVQRNMVQAWAWMKLADENGYEDAKGGIENIAVELSDDQLAQARALAKSLTLPERTWQAPPMANTRVEKFLRQYILSGAATSDMTSFSAATNGAVGTPSASSNAGEAVSANTASNQSFTPQLSGNWQIQLGSFRNQLVATEAGKKLEARLPQLTSEYQWVAEEAFRGSNKGHFYRLKLQGFMDYTVADRTCNTLIMNGFACMIVENK